MFQEMDNNEKWLGRFEIDQVELIEVKIQKWILKT